MDHVVPHEAGSVPGIGVLHEGSDTRPGGENVSPPDVNVAGEVVLDLAEYELDVTLAGPGAGGDRARSVGGPGDGVTLPGQEEDDPAVTGGGVQQAHAGRGVVVGQHDVDPGRGTDDVSALSIVHLPDGVSEGPRGVDDTLGIDNKLLSRQLVPGPGSGDFSVCFYQVYHLDMVSYGGTKPKIFCCRKD